MGSCLSREKRGLSRLIVEAVGTGLATTEKILINYMKTTLLWE